MFRLDNSTGGIDSVASAHILFAVMTRETWQEWFRRMTAGMAQKDAAAGVNQSTVSKWLQGKGGTPRAENVVMIARSLRRSPVEALVAAGYLEPSDAAAVIEVNRSAADLSDDELVAELAGRLAQRPPTAQVDNITGLLAAPDESA